MNGHNETLAEIVAEIRQLAATAKDGVITIHGPTIADRIGKAVRMDMVKVSLLAAEKAAEIAIKKCRRLFNNAAEMQRIEAAHKREVDKLNSVIQAQRSAFDAEQDRQRRAAPGNLAAMREALERTDLFLSALGKWLKVNDEGQEYALAAGVIHTLVEHALAAPARNCDMPLVVDGPADNNADKAWRVFKHHNPDAYFDVPGLLRCINWLLAPAKEQRGECNEQK